MSDLPPPSRNSPALVAEVTKRTGIIWIGVPGQARPRPAWHIWRSVTQPPAGDAGPPPPGAAYLVTGPGEQLVPGLAEAGRVTVTVRSGQTGAAVLTWNADVSRVEPGGGEWEAVIGALVAGRLNPTAEPAGASPARRWARECTIHRLAPVPT